ncbi:kelch-like protein 29 [Tachysurus ichikawai]
MSRHHHRFERDYRGVWERRERPAPLHNGVTSNACTPAGPTLANGNNRPGLLPLPVIPSLLPTPVTIAVTTSSNELAAKRAGVPVSAPTVKERNSIVCCGSNTMVSRVIKTEQAPLR